MHILVERIVSSRFFGTIFVGKVLGGELLGKTIQVKTSAKSMIGSPSPGEIWDVDGPISLTKWGIQITSEMAVRTRPSGRLLVSYLSNSCPGIGPTRARRLWDRWGNELPRVLEHGDLIKIAAILAPSRPVLSIRLAALVVKIWKKTEAEARLVEWFQNHGIDSTPLLHLCFRLFGTKAAERLQANPWCLASMLSWPRCDAVGLKILSERGVADPRISTKRLLGAVDSAVLDILAQGDTKVSADRMKIFLTRKLGDGHLAEQAMAIGLEYGAVVARGAFLQPPGSALMEQQLKTGLLRLLENQTRIQESKSSHRAGILDDLTKEKSFRLASEQTAAINQALTSHLCCLVGGAGTGKTTILRYAVGTWHRLGGNVLMATLSGKAALRLSQSTGMLAKTLARTLGELKERAKNKNVNELAKIDHKTLVVIDEASMVDLTTFYRLLKYFKPGTRLLLVGDPAQLPPIGFGLVFQRLVEDDKITARLTTIYRQTEVSGIPMVAASIRERRMPTFLDYKGLGSGVSFIDATLDQINKVLDDVSNELRDDLLMITALKKGPVGTMQLNRVFHKKYIKNTTFQSINGYFGQCFCPGEPVIHTKNDYKRNVFNGSLGWVRNVDLDSRSLVACFDGKDIRFSSAQLIDLELAYSITCHKAQGSQAKRVIVLIHETRLMDPSWLYTAITRAEKQVVLVGDRVALEKALTRPSLAERRKVGFVWNVDQRVYQ